MCDFVDTLYNASFFSTGRTTIGHGPMDINIQGPGVEAQHCYIENRSGVILLHPCGNLCAIDGLQVTQPIRLSQGKILLSREALDTDNLFGVFMTLFLGSLSCV